MTDPDILARLRQGWLAHWDTAVRFVMVYASEWVRLTNLTLESANEIERLRAERDEARRSYCYATGNGYEQRAINVAQSKGWDCFKENTNG